VDAPITVLVKQEALLPSVTFTAPPQGSMESSTAPITEEHSRLATQESIPVAPPTPALQQSSQGSTTMENDGGLNNTTVVAGPVTVDATATVLSQEAAVAYMYMYFPRYPRDQQPLNCNRRPQKIVASWPHRKAFQLHHFLFCNHPLKNPRSKSLTVAVIFIFYLTILLLDFSFQSKLKVLLLPVLREIKNTYFRALSGFMHLFLSFSRVFLPIFRIVASVRRRMPQWSLFISKRIAMRMMRGEWHQASHAAASRSEDIHERK
jgi:hypothetical protein